MLLKILRTLFLTILVFNSGLVASAKPKARVTKKAASKPTAPLKAKPLSPAQLQGKVVYVLNRDVWAIEPQTRQKFLLYKNLFFPADKNPNNYSEVYGSGLNFGRADIAWSLDRTQVAFTYRKPEFQGSELFVMRWDGSGKRQISTGNYESEISTPRWNPNGKILAYTEHSNYRMGGPGYGWQRIGFSMVDKAAAPIDVKIEGQTSFEPFWSRDGKSLLYSQSPQEVDYMEFDSVTQKVAALDGAPATDYKGNWSDFLLNNESSNGQWLAQRDSQIREYWNLLRPNTVASQGAAWSIGIHSGFEATRIFPGNNGKQFVSEAHFDIWRLDEKQFARFDRFDGIWFAQSENGDANLPRLLVKDGNLVDWFDDSK